MQKSCYVDVAKRVWEKYKTLKFSTFKGMNGYPAQVTLDGVARLSKVIQDEELRDEVIKYLRPFVNGEVAEVHGAYTDYYRVGGVPAAFMYARGYMPEAEKVLVTAAEKLCKDFPRDDFGNFAGDEKWRPRNFIWIDSVFFAVPFLVWIGKTANRPDLVEEGIKQMIGHHKVLFNPQYKLYHQVANPRGKGGVTPCFWGRGVGWGIAPLAEILFDLKDHPIHPQLLAMYRDVLEGCYNTLGSDDMWHQVMEDEASYPETSGTALILYAIARGLKNGSVAKEDYDRFMDCLKRGLRGMSKYIALDGSIYNVCIGCLAPGVSGSAIDYAQRPYETNDPHGAGPVILMMSAVQQLFQRGEIPDLPEVLNGK